MLRPFCADSAALQCCSSWLKSAAERSPALCPAAFTCYQAALQLRPNFPQGLNNLAVIFTAQGRAQDALQMLQAAIAAAPDYAEAFNNLGVLQREVGAIKASLCTPQTWVTHDGSVGQSTGCFGRCLHNAEPQGALQMPGAPVAVVLDCAAAYNSLAALQQEAGASTQSMSMPCMLLAQGCLLCDAQNTSSEVFEHAMA